MGPENRKQPHFGAAPAAEVSGGTKITRFLPRNSPRADTWLAALGWAPEAGLKGSAKTSQIGGFQPRIGMNSRILDSAGPKMLKMNAYFGKNGKKRKKIHLIGV